MDIRKAGAGILGAGTLIVGGLDAAVLNETPIERVEIVANERVEARQVGNIVETTFPWKGQEGLKVVVDLGVPTIGERIADKRKREVITEVVDFGEGGFKVDILLNEKPDTNRFCYLIEGHQNYDFFYQPPLWKEDPFLWEPTKTCTDTECDTDGDGVMDAFRDEDIVGSYAVYHKESRDNRATKVEGNIWDKYSTSTQEKMVEDGKLFRRATEDGQSFEWYEVVEDYKTGKVMHIPRPQVWELNDEENTKEWAELLYEDGELCVTARPEFLDTATYPVRIDPTFGYTTIGGSTLGLGSTRKHGSFADAPEAGDLVSFTAYGRGNSASGDLVVALYSDSSGTADARIATHGGSISFTTTAAWRDINIVASLIGSTRYWLFAQANQDYQAYYDTGFSSQLKYTNPTTFDVWNDPFGTQTTASGKVSIYATYTASGGGGDPAPTDSVIMFE